MCDFLKVPMTPAGALSRMSRSKISFSKTSSFSQIKAAPLFYLPRAQLSIHFCFNVTGKTGFCIYNMIRFHGLLYIVLGMIVSSMVWRKPPTMPHSLDDGHSSSSACTPTENNNDPTAPTPASPYSYALELHQFKPWKPLQDDQHAWCGGGTKKPKKSDGRRPGLYLNKVHKTGSSTTGGITHNIAANVARRKFGNDNNDNNSTATATCFASASHGNKKWAARVQEPYLLWTVLREPASRILSSYTFFQISRNGEEPTLPHFQQTAEKQKGYQLDYLAQTYGRYLNNEDLVRTKYPVKGTPAKETTELQALSIIQQSVLDEYHFVGVLERMDESLVVMKELFHLEHEDMIVLSSKTSGGYDDGASDKGCVMIQKTIKTPEMKAYLATDFRDYNYDFLLYDIINRTLDATIDALGRDKIEQGVQIHRKIQALAEEKCQAEAVFPCSSDGVLQREASSKSCYRSDFACGHECVARVLQSASW